MLRRLKKLAARALLRSNDPDSLGRLSERLQVLTIQIEDKRRRLAARRAGAPPLVTPDGHALSVCVREDQTPWESVPLDKRAIPGMTSEEECRYFRYLGRFYSGQGAAVELGPWLGRSTHHIALGLSENPAFAGQTLHVFDDFVWRSEWMDPFVSPSDRPAQGESFLPLFERYTAHLDCLKVERRSVLDLGDNASVPALSWSGGPIEILYVDCGRTHAINQAWWDAFQPSFIPGRTIVMMQDWGVHRELPRQWYNQTLEFTESKGDALQLVHELCGGPTATFVYKG